MGSTNGATRGQLRPYLSGRTPPFLLVGLLVIVGILGFSYRSLNIQYNDLLTEIQKLQERLRVYAEKRESVEKMNSALQAQLQTDKDESKKYKITMYKRDQELSTLTEQLRNREDDVAKANLQIETLKTDLEKLESRDKQKDLEIGSLQDQAKSLKIENQEIADAKAEILKKLEVAQREVDMTRKDSGHMQSVNSVPQDVPADKKEIPSLNPDEGMPLQNRDIKFPPQIPVTNKIVVEPKIPTPAPESPDESNMEKLSDAATSKIPLNDAANNPIEADPNGGQNSNAV